MTLEIRFKMWNAHRWYKYKMGIIPDRSRDSGLLMILMKIWRVLLGRNCKRMRSFLRNQISQQILKRMTRKLKHQRIKMKKKHQLRFQCFMDKKNKQSIKRLHYKMIDRIFFSSSYIRIFLDIQQFIKEEAYYLLLMAYLKNHSQKNRL